jgi:hypothetical protein
VKPLPMHHPAQENPPEGKEGPLAGIPDKRLRSLVALLWLSPEERAELTAERVRRMASAPLTQTSRL